MALSQLPARAQSDWSHNQFFVFGFYFWRPLAYICRALLPYQQQALESYDIKSLVVPVSRIVPSMLHWCRGLLLLLLLLQHGSSQELSEQQQAEVAETTLAMEMPTSAEQLSPAVEHTELPAATATAATVTATTTAKPLEHAETAIEMTLKPVDAPPDYVNDAAAQTEHEEEEQPAAEPEQPAAEHEQPAAEPEQPAAEPEPPAAEPEQPAAETEQQYTAATTAPAKHEEEQPKQHEPTTASPAPVPSNFISCYSCSGYANSSCHDKPSEMIKCAKSLPMTDGCYTLIKRDTKLISRGCIIQLSQANEPNYCLKEPKLCLMCLESNCNTHRAPIIDGAGAAQLRAGLLLTTAGSMCILAALHFNQL
ncbi:translation initiation factor IF-2 [Drosophila busckii]|uniref:translation initiation factor IF-2 n=1 Tax=Drosophila busckii TaxID=30019 RepID=UPI00083EA2F3|nr:translation initiation factor IF-2 [Drosophila busckii]